MRRARPAGALVLAALLAAGARRAEADAGPAWAAGVSEARQRDANALFDQANQLFAQQAHAAALEKYRAAAAIWDHPMIRFNMAVTEIRLEQILEAALDLEAALRFGAEPFSADLYDQALDYQTLLKGRIGEIRVSCAQADVEVRIDGRAWFSCPGARRLPVLAGAHVIAGESAGFLPRSLRVVVAGGAVVTQEMSLVSLDAAATVVYPYPRWIPWTIAGGGAAVALGGLGFYLSGKNQLAAFHSAFARECATGCEADLSDHPLLARERDGAVTKGKIGASMMIAGGAIAAGGVVFLIGNRPVRVLPRIEAVPAPGGIAASLGWAF